MSNIDDGGPAFPSPDSVYANGERGYGAWGMTLRDWLAGKALQGMLANPAYNSASNEVLSSHAYDLADRMIAVRKGDNQ